MPLRQPTARLTPGTGHAGAQLASVRARKLVADRVIDGPNETDAPTEYALPGGLAARFSSERFHSVLAAIDAGTLPLEGEVSALKRELRKMQARLRRTLVGTDGKTDIVGWALMETLFSPDPLAAQNALRKWLGILEQHEVGEFAKRAVAIHLLLIEVRRSHYMRPGRQTKR